jgi:prepilin-type N-terminal cleavage/methylation domain-containing protein
MLARIRKAMEKKDEGFTLIELLVVMIIIGILAAIAIPVFLSQKKKAYESSLKADLNTIADDIGTAQVDDPTAIAITGTGAASPYNVVVTPTPGTAITVSLSPNNQFVAGTVDQANGGAYCIELNNSNDATNTWAAYSTAAGSHVAKGSCAAAVFTPAT